MCVVYDTLTQKHNVIFFLTLNISHHIHSSSYIHLTISLSNHMQKLKTKSINRSLSFLRSIHLIISVCDQVVCLSFDRFVIKELITVSVNLSPNQFRSCACKLIFSLYKLVSVVFSRYILIKIVLIKIFSYISHIIHC